MIKPRIGDRVLAWRFEGGPRTGRVVEVYGRWWNRWYGVQVSTFMGPHVYHFRARHLVGLTEESGE